MVRSGRSAPAADRSRPDVLSSPVARLGLICCGLMFVLGIVMTGIATNSTVRGTKISSSAFVDVRELLGVAIEASRAGGKEVWEVARTGVLQEFTKGDNKEIVTVADGRSNQVIMGMLNAQFKGVAIRSEEGPTSSPTPAQGKASKEATKLLSNVLPQMPAQAGRLSVWVDPLDATKEYSQRLLQYVSVMVCIAVDGAPVAGVIHFPFTDKTVWAVRPAWSGAGSSSTLVSPRQAPPPPADPRASTADGEKIRFVVSRSHAGEAVRESDLLGASDVNQAAGAGFKAVEVLQGQADAYYHSTDIKKWDICAAEAILRAAGGSLTTREGKAIDYSADSPELVKADATTGAGGVAASVYYHETLLHRLVNLSASSAGKD